MKAMTLCGALAAVAGCAADELQLASVDEAIYVLDDAKWTADTVAVCWEKESYDDGTLNYERRLVKEAVENAWERVARIHFQGWGRCPDSTAFRGIRIRAAPGVSYTTGLGQHIADDRPGMVLDLTTRQDGCTGTEGECIRQRAVHEFGHALGLAHEQNRPDSPDGCPEQGTDGDNIYGTSYDDESVMNYCRPDPYAGLSNLDVIGIKRAYGPKGHRTIVARGGMCWDLPSGNTTNGTYVNRFRCHGASNQVWTWEPGPRRIKVLGKCIQWQDGAAGLFVNDCGAATTAQQFQFGLGEYRTAGDRCLTSFGQGTPLYVNPCESVRDTRITNDQAFVYLTTSRQIKTASGLCLERTYNAYLGLHVTPQACASRSSQRWTLESPGRIRNDAGLCMAPRQDGRITMTDCATLNSETHPWHLATAINHGNECVVAGGSTDGGYLDVRACNGDVSQVFDFYF